MADLHEGEGPCSDRGSFFKGLRGAADQERKVVILGDMVTSIFPDDRRFNVEEHTTSFADQEAFIEDEVIRPFKDIIECWARGNHEDWLTKRHGDFMDKICTRHKVNYIGYQINTLYKLGDKRFTAYYTHGRRNFNRRAGEDVRKPVNKQVGLKDYFRDTGIEADFYICGHGHQAIMYTDPFDLRLVNRGGEHYSEEYLPTGEGKVYCMTPSFMRTYMTGSENYAAIAGFKASEVGYIDLDLTEDLNIYDVRLVVSNNGRFKTKDSYRRRMELGRD
jgi:hypothetical protein